MNDSITVFLEKVSSSPKLQEQLTAFQNEAEQRLIANLVALSTETGAPVSADKWIAARAAAPALGLSDDDLSAVAGGAGTAPSSPWRQYLGVLPYMIANSEPTTRNPQPFIDGLKRARSKKSPTA